MIQIHSTIGAKGVEFALVSDRLRGEVAKFDIADKKGNVIVAKDKRITVKHIREIEKAGVKKISCTNRVYTWSCSRKKYYRYKRRVKSLQTPMMKPLKNC